MGSIKTLLAAPLAAVMLSFGLVALAGCGPSVEEVVQQRVADELELLKTHDAATMEELAADADIAELSAYGIDPQAFVASYLDGFDYRIDEVVVDGDTALATVVLTCKSFDTFAAQLEEASAALALDEGTASLQGEELNEAVGAAMLEALGAVEPAESKPLELPFAREDNTWSPAEGADAMLASALFEG